jgi:prepilin signal peptidase PulO-like enzyme (type II secretory pathway)
MIDVLLVIIGVVVLIVGTVTDFKVREIPDWVSYSAIIAGLGLRLLYSVATFDWSFFLLGLLGFAVFAALGIFMFYTGQWGGGDTKLLMGIGALFATYPNFLLNYFNPYLKYSFLLAFLINLVLIGSFYGLLWSVVLSIKHRKNFVKEFANVTKEVPIKKIRRAVLILLAAALVSSFVIRNLFFQITVLSFALIIFLTFYVWVYVKVVEKACMHKYVPPSKLTEGDWIAKDVYIKGKRITGPKDLGISKESIKKLLKGKVRRVLIKEGIPFIPSFLIAFIVSLIWGNVLFILMGL